MTRSLAAAAAALVIAGSLHAQPPGITREMIMRQLPQEGAPVAVVGPYETVMEPAFGSAEHAVYRPADLAALPAREKLPIVVWGNGGCARNSGMFAGFLGNIASHGYLVVTTAAPEGVTGRATADDLRKGLDWAFAEAGRSGSPLAGKIDTDKVAVMGVSCGGVLTLSLAGDPRVDTIGVFNSGVSAPGAANAIPGNPTTEVLKTIHGPALYLDGGEADFMTPVAKANFDAIDHVPIFYGSRHNGGHSATYFHPNGGEFANVTVAWLDWQLKGEEAAAKMFRGRDCTLCTNPNWTTDSKGL
ncbi:MAG TPA: alpha/beta hydrolase [Gammaproteobacteria bacterium]